MRFESLLDRQERGEITQADAAELLGVSVRTFQRWAGRFEEAGSDGLADRRLGRPSPRRAPAKELERMLGLYRDKYSDFTVKHFHEQLVKRHDYVLGYTVTKLALQAAGLVRPAPKRSAHYDDRGGERLAQDTLHVGAQPAVCDRARGGGDRVRLRSRRRLAQHSVCDRGARGGQRQYRCLERPAAAAA